MKSLENQRYNFKNAADKYIYIKLMLILCCFPFSFLKKPKQKAPQNTALGKSCFHHVIFFWGKDPVPRLLNKCFILEN